MKSLHFYIAFLFVILSLPAASVLAAQFQAGETVTIPKDQLMSDNVYIAGAEITVSSSPLKDLVAAGGKVIVNGQVWGDALLAGGSVDVLERVQGDLRAAGGAVKVAHTVGGDTIIAGGQVQILPGSTISGDVVLAGGQVVIDGIINGTTRVYGGSITINGTVSGPLYIRAGESITFGEKAVVKGSIIYTAPVEATITEGAKLPENITFTQVPAPGSETQESVMKGVLAIAGILFFLKSVAVLLTSLIVAASFNRLSLAVANETLGRFWYMTLIGFVTLITAPVAIIFLLVTVVGMYIGFIVAALYGLVLLGAGIFLNITTGALLAKLIKKEIRVNWKWVLLGTVIVSLVALIPIIGWVAIGLMYLASVGAGVMSLTRDAKAKM